MLANHAICYRRLPLAFDKNLDALPKELIRVLKPATSSVQKCKLLCCQGSSRGVSFVPTSFGIEETKTRTVAITLHGISSDETEIAKLPEHFLGLDGVDAVEFGNMTTGGLRGNKIQVQLEVEKRVSLASLVEAVHSIEDEFLALPFKCHSWLWRGNKINYAEAGKGSPMVLIHGFGGNAGHFRNIISILADKHRVYAVDLLGFGDSDKPSEAEYGPGLWGDLIIGWLILSDFVEEIVKEPSILIGNSVGSLTALTAASIINETRLRGLVLLNVAGGMNRKGLTEEGVLMRIMTPIFVFTEWLLLQPSVGAYLFDKFRSKDNVMQVLKKQVYRNKEMVTDQLVDILYEPSNDPGAVDVFVKIFTGNPGRRPEGLMSEISKPTLVLWGDKDPWTPINGKVANFFRKLQSVRDNVTVIPLEDVGHCPHDDRPELAAKHILEWADGLEAGEKSLRGS